MGLFRQHHQRMLVVDYHCHVSVPTVRARDSRHNRLYELVMSDRGRDSLVSWDLLGLASPF